MERRIRTTLCLCELESGHPRPDEPCRDLRLYLLLIRLIILTVEQEVFYVGESFTRQALLLGQATNDGLDELIPPSYDVLGRPDRRTEETEDEQEGGISRREVLNVLVVYR